MDTRYAPNKWDDEIDLREYVSVLLRWKWVIAGLIVAAVSVAAVFSYAVMTPTYESSGVFFPPEGTETSREVWRAFGEGDRVLHGVVERTGMPVTLRELREERIEVDLESGTGLLRVTASADNADGAHGLLEAWHASFNEEALRYAEQRIDRRLQAAEAQLASVRALASATSPGATANEGEPAPGQAEQDVLVLLDVVAYNERIVDVQAERDRLLNLRGDLPELA